MGLITSLASAPARVLSMWTHPYDAASTKSRMRNFRPSRSSINSLTAAHGDELAARATHLARNNSFASNGVDAIVAATIGIGIKPQIITSNTALKKKLQDLWWEWVDQCCIDGTLNFYGVQSVVTRSVVVSGESFCRFRYRRGRLQSSLGLKIPLQLQLIDPAQCPFDKNQLSLTDGGRIVNGIRMDATGRRLSYLMWDTHPGEIAAVASSLLKEIDAREIIHTFRPTHAGQVRGETWLTRVLVSLWELDQYEDAELVRKKVAALFTGFIREMNPADPAFKKDEDVTDDPDGVESVSLEPGTLQKLGSGEDITFSSPADVGANFEPFILHVLRKIASGFGIPYHALTGDLRQVSFSSIRAGATEFQRRIEQFQHLVIAYQFCRRVWVEWVRAAMNAGIITETEAMEAMKVEWRMPRREWVDPEADIRAEAEMVNQGFKPRSQVINEMGDDPETVDAQIAADRKREKSLGLEFPTNESKKLQQQQQQQARAKETP